MHAKATQAAKRSGTRPVPAAPAPEMAPHPSEVASPVEGPSPRELIENNLVRAMLEYGTDVVRVEVQDGEEKSTVEVPFAELVVHRLEEEDMVFEHGLNQTVFERFVSELDQERILTAEQLANDPDANIQAKVASALIHPYALSPNWEQRHKIYPTVERDQLTTLLEDSLHRMHLMDLKASLDRIRTKMEAGGMSVEEERAMLAEKIQLDREIQTTLAHFGTVILP